MNFQQDGQDFTDQPIELQQALHGWEEAMRMFNANYYRLQQAIEPDSPYRGELIQLWEQSIVHLEFLHDAINPELAEETPDKLIHELKEHTSILQQHNKRVATLLNRLSK